MQVDGYIRVSKVAGRSGESFISPDEQRRSIEAYAAAHKLTVADWHKDLDQSGGTLDRPAFQVALDRCRAGQTGGIIAAKLDRLTRSTIGLGTLIDEAREGGWNLIAVDFGLDLFKPNGKLVANVLASVAEWERERRADDWAAARRNAVERGIPNGRAPIGYAKRPDGRLEVDEPEAAKVREAFRLRAAGVPFSQIARRFEWSHSTVRQMTANVAYLGIARSGAHSNDKAHPALVTHEAFDAANAARTVQPIPPGDTTRGLLLQGIARCGGCGKTLKAVPRKRKDGTRVMSYYCKNASAAACTERAYVHTDELDAFIAEWFARALQTVPKVVDVVAASRELEEAQVERADAEAQLLAFVDNASALDAKLFQRGLDARQARLDEAQALVARLSGHLAKLPAGGSFPALWSGYDSERRHEILAGFVDRVVVHRGASTDIAGHIEIVWADGTRAEIADDEAATWMVAA